MIPESGNRLSDKIVLDRRTGPGTGSMRLDQTARAFPLLIESEAEFYDIVLTRFLHANRSSTSLENALATGEGFDDRF
ncbi:hypothetical protein J2S34_001343 [Nitrobacter winogradskyi]|uniref:Uncharacterized protein n=1 Tax=Nitrobacter winogradskyi TaxID=913 RepID=A0ACC6AH42_NITWI|nr:hypothetical protein [Nitrobacter winogradskyi]